MIFMCTALKLSNIYIYIYIYIYVWCQRVFYFLFVPSDSNIYINMYIEKRDIYQSDFISKETHDFSEKEKQRLIYYF